MDLSDLLADENAHVQAKEAEALAILTACAGPAMKTLGEAKREFGHVLRLPDLGVFVSPTAHELYKKGKRDATRFLFDAYATSVFRLVPDAETFILLLGAIGERVNTKLNDVSDQHEAELCRLEWVKLAWERAKPNAIQSAWMRLQALWRPRRLKSTSRSREADPRNPEPSATAPKTVDVTPVPNAAATTNDDGQGMIDQADGSARVVTATAVPEPERVDDAARGATAADAEARAASDCRAGEESDTESAKLEAWYRELQAELSPDQQTQLVDAMNKIAEILEEDASAPVRTLTIANVGLFVTDFQSMAPRDLCKVLELKATELRARTTANRILRPVPGDTVPNGVETAPAQPQPVVTPNSQSACRKRGPTRDYKTAARVAEVIARVAPEGDWRSRLDDVLMALDDEKIPTPKTWEQKHGYRNWYAAVADSSTRGRHLAVEAIKHHLKRAKEQPTETIP